MNDTLKTTFKNFADYMLEPHRPTNGISGLNSIKFYLVFALYSASFLVLMRDPFFFQYGVFTYSQGVVPLLLAYLVVATLCWELSFFGKSSGVNLLLHVLMIAPLALVMARICVSGSSEGKPIVKSVIEFIGKQKFGTFGSLNELIPQWLVDVFSNWKISLFFLLFVGSQCIKRLAMRISIMATMFIIPIFSTLQSGADMRFFTLGCILLIAGMTMQFCRYDSIIFFENVAEKLRCGGDKTMLLCIMKTMTQIHERGRISDTNLIHLVRSEYEKAGEFSEVELRVMAAKLTQMMMYEYNLVRVRNDADGAYIVATENLYRNSGLLSELTLFPKLAIMLVVAVVWVLLPYDIIPDAMPIIGTLDDVLVTMLSGVVLRNSFGAVDSLSIERRK